MNTITQKRKAFTLVEIIIAIAVFSIAVFVMYSVLSQVKKQKKLSYQEYKKDYKIVELKRLIYQDFTTAKDIEINSQKNIAIFKSTDSLYGITNPYVLYILKNHILYRVESIHKINVDLRNIDSRTIKIMPLLKNIKYFKIYLSKKAISIWINTKNPIYLHIIKADNYTNNS